MTTGSHGGPTPAARQENKNTGQTLSSMIDEFAEFSKSAVQVASRGWKASVDANATLAVGAIASWARSAEAWSKAVSASPTRIDSDEVTDLWKKGAEIAQSWVKAMATSWREAANVLVRALVAKDKPA